MCCANAWAAECLKFTDSVTTECAVFLSHSKAVDSQLMLHAVIHQKTSFLETVASFPAPTFLISLSGISSHQLFLAVYKTLTVYLLNCAKEAFFPFCFCSLFFQPGFIQSSGKSLDSCLKETFFYSPFLLWNKNIKSKRGEFVSLCFVVGLRLQLECVPSAWHSVAFSTEPAEPFSGATPVINWPDSGESWSEPGRNRGDGAGRKTEGIKGAFGSRVCSQTQSTLCSK